MKQPSDVTLMPRQIQNSNGVKQKAGRRVSKAQRKLEQEQSHHVAIRQALADASSDRGLD